MLRFDVAGRLLLATLAWSSFANAGTVQDAFIFPALPDGSSQLTVGRGYSISWTSDLLGSFPTYCPSCNVTKLDLWVGGTTAGSTFAHKIVSNLNLNTTSSYIWTCDLSDSELGVESDWNFRFLPSGQTPQTTSQQISSPICLIRSASASTSSSAPASSSTTPASSTAPSSSSSSTSPASASTSSGAPQTGNGSSGLSTGAAAGIGVGATVAALGLLAAGFIAFRRAARRRQAGSAPGNAPDGGMGSPPKQSYYDPHSPNPTVNSYPMAPSWQSPSSAGNTWQAPSPAGNTWQAPNPAGNAYASELPGGNQHQAAELGSH